MTEQAYYDHDLWWLVVDERAPTSRMTVVYCDFDIVFIPLAKDEHVVSFTLEHTSIPPLIDRIRVDIEADEKVTDEDLAGILRSSRFIGELEDSELLVLVPLKHKLWRLNAMKTYSASFEVVRWTPVKPLDIAVIKWLDSTRRRAHVKLGLRIGGVLTVAGGLAYAASSKHQGIAKRIVQLARIVKNIQG